MSSKREQRLIDKGRRLRGFLENENANVRSALDALKAAVVAGDSKGIGRAVSNVRRAEKSLRNAAGRVHIDKPGGGPPAGLVDPGGGGGKRR